MVHRCNPRRMLTLADIMNRRTITKLRLTGRTGHLSHQSNRLRLSHTKMTTLRNFHRLFTDLRQHRITSFLPTSHSRTTQTRIIGRYASFTYASRPRQFTHRLGSPFRLWIATRTEGHSSLYRQEGSTSNHSTTRPNAADDSFP